MSHVANVANNGSKLAKMLVNNSDTNARTSCAKDTSCKDDIITIKSQQKSLRRQLSDQLEASASATPLEQTLAACAGLQEELDKFKASILLLQKSLPSIDQELEKAKRQKEEEAKRQRSERRKLTVTMQLESYQDVDCKCNQVNYDETQGCQLDSLREKQFGLISSAL